MNIIPLLEVERRLERREDRMALLDELGKGSEPERWLGRALRRDLAFLAKHPDLTFPCVYRLGWWHDAPDAGTSLRSAPLRPLLEVWRREWESQRRGPWLRALRPPVIPLDSPLLEEYCGVDWRAPVAFSRDDTVVGARGSPPVAWERESGRWLSGDEARARMGAAESPRYAFGDQPSADCEWLCDNLTGETMGFPLPLPGYMSFRQYAVELSEGRVLAAAESDDGGGALYLVDFRNKQALFQFDELGWRIDMAGSLNRQLALVRDAWGDSFFLEALDTPRMHGPFLIGHGHNALSSQGRLAATVMHGVLRVWDVRDLWSRPRPRPLSPPWEQSARFSSDGELLLTENLLCDARTGQVIQTFDFSERRGVWLAGRPPRKGRALVRGGFIEINEQGVQRWDARGQRIVQDGGRGHEILPHLVISPDGTRYAWSLGLYGHPEVQIRRLEDDQELTCLPGWKIEPLEWSPGGELLASLTGEGEVRLLPEKGRERTLGAHPHATHVRFSHDGRLLAALDDKHVKIWDTRTGLLHAESLLSDLGVESARDALPFGWAGFHEHGHPYVGRFEGGVFEITYGQEGTTVARVPSGEPLISDPTGTRWAGSTSHYALEER
ncbi:WD40 repeat domain-containing protein [Pyxidicoccus fallax]|uniref:WD40 repeat domain-containing protein n=1 Tax=Pyxidicoccus fallax TaxID=394095 RepID=A0A848LJI4_9BACT|nr:WD40 repeat domain-containing protein [Pyxidicoccus fallax]NMO17872.1 WD40 repeat domain-containing protein [Pyxidicoccus fallax]NPC81160.1 WD40 repeat domain-containing protein [Pyxidicoccus fallax]